MSPASESTPTDLATPAPPRLAGLLVPLLILAALGLAGVLWAGSSVRDDIQRAVGSSLYPIRLESPGTYTAELEAGRTEFIVFGIDMSDIGLSTSDGTAVPVEPFDNPVTLTVNGVSATIDADRLSTVVIEQSGRHSITLDGVGDVYTRAFGDAPGAERNDRFLRGPNIAGAILPNLPVLLVAAVALLVGVVGAGLSYRARRRHRDRVALEMRYPRG